MTADDLLLWELAFCTAVEQLPGDDCQEEREAMYRRLIRMLETADHPIHVVVSAAERSWGLTSYDRLLLFLWLAEGYIDGVTGSPAQAVEHGRLLSVVESVEGAARLGAMTIDPNDCT